jgi:hypothetical protein
MSREPFADSRLRLQWAKEGFGDHERCTRIYFKRTACTPFIELDPDGIREHHKLRLGKPFPSSPTRHTIHVIEDLRAALDLTAIAVARLAKLLVDEVHFPFCKTAADFKSRIGSCCKGFPEQITGLFASFEPYGRTDNLLFAVNELCTASKHRVVVPVASAAGVNLPYIESIGGSGPIIINAGGLFDSEKNEITYATTKRGLHLKYHAEFALGIAFGDVGPLEGYLVLPNLDGMIRVVAMIVDGTEAESRRLAALL